MIKCVLRRAINNTAIGDDTDDNNDTTNNSIHDYIGFFGIYSNWAKNEEILNLYE